MEKGDKRRQEQPPPPPPSDAEAADLGCCCFCGRTQQQQPLTSSGSNSNSPEQQKKPPLLLLLNCFHGCCRECAAAAGDAAAVIVCRVCRCSTVRADLGEVLAPAVSFCSSPPVAPPAAPPACDNCSQEADEGGRREAVDRCADCNQLLCRPCLRLHNKFAPGHRTGPLAAAPPLPHCAEHVSAVRSFYCADCGRLRCDACSVACRGRDHALSSAADAVAAASAESGDGGLVAIARDAIRDALGELSNRRRAGAAADSPALRHASEGYGVSEELPLRLLQRNERRAVDAIRRVRALAERRLAEERNRQAVAVARVDAQLDRLASYAERLLQLRPDPDQTAAAVAALDQRRQLVTRMRALLAEREALTSSGAVSSTDHSDAAQLQQSVVRETSAEEADAAAAALLGLARDSLNFPRSSTRDVENDQELLAAIQGDGESDETDDEENWKNDGSSSGGGSTSGDCNDGSDEIMTAAPSCDKANALLSAASLEPPAGGSVSGANGSGQVVDEVKLLSCSSCGKVPADPMILSCLHCLCRACLNGQTDAPGQPSQPTAGSEVSAGGEANGRRTEQQQQITCSLCGLVTPASRVRLSGFAAERLRQLAGVATETAAAGTAAATACYCKACDSKGVKSVDASHICPDCQNAPYCTQCLRWHDKFLKDHAPFSIDSSAAASSSSSSGTPALSNLRPCERHGAGCRYDTYCFACGTLRCTNGGRECTSAGHDALAIFSRRVIEFAQDSAASLRTDLASAIAQNKAAAVCGARLAGALTKALNSELKSVDDAAATICRAVEMMRADASRELLTVYDSLRTVALPRLQTACDVASRHIAQVVAFCRLLLSSGSDADLLEHHSQVAARFRALGAEVDRLASAGSGFESSPPRPAVIERSDVDRALIARWIGLPRDDPASLLVFDESAREQRQRQQQQQQSSLQRQQPSVATPIERKQSLPIVNRAVCHSPAQGDHFGRSTASSGQPERMRSIRYENTEPSSTRAQTCGTSRSVSWTTSNARPSTASAGGSAALRWLHFNTVPTRVVEVNDDARSLQLLFRSQSEGGLGGVRSVIVAGPRQGLAEYELESGAMLSSWMPTPETGSERDEQPAVTTVALAAVAGGTADDVGSNGDGGSSSSSSSRGGADVSGDLVYVGLADSEPAVILLRRVVIDDGIAWVDEQRIALRAIPWQLATTGDLLVVAGGQRGTEDQQPCYSPGPFLDLYRRSGSSETEELFSRETAYDIRCVAISGNIVVTLSNNRMPSASDSDEQAYVLEAFSRQGDVLWQKIGCDAIDICALPAAGLLGLVSHEDQRILALNAADGDYVADVPGGDGEELRNASRVCYSFGMKPYAMAVLSAESWVSVYSAICED